MNALTRLSLKDLQIIFNCSESTAQRRKKELQNALNIHHVRVIDVAKYENYDINYLLLVLK